LIIHCLNFLFQHSLQPKFLTGGALEEEEYVDDNTFTSLNQPRVSQIKASLALSISQLKLNFNLANPNLSVSSNVTSNEPLVTSRSDIPSSFRMQMDRYSNPIFRRKCNLLVIVKIMLALRQFHVLVSKCRDESQNAVTKIVQVKIIHRFLKKCVRIWRAERINKALIQSLSSDDSSVTEEEVYFGENAQKIANTKSSSLVRMMKRVKLKLRFSIFYEQRVLASFVIGKFLTDISNLPRMKCRQFRRYVRLLEMRCSTSYDFLKCGVRKFFELYS
jgi:hypothetical protein